MKIVSRFRPLLLMLFVSGLSFLLLRAQFPLAAQPDAVPDRFARILADRQPAQPLAPQTAVPCANGMAGLYPCENVDLLAFLPLSALGGGESNDVWGWTDPVTTKEYALLGRTTGTSFVDISDPLNPIYLGNLPPHTNSSIWRDVKVYSDHAFIVSEASGHGMQIFDLTQLRTVTNPPQTFSATAHYSGFGSAHNIVINEDSGFAYGVGTNSCGGGLHIINIQNPLQPAAAGCFSSDGYTHDAQCVNYAGPDPDYQGAELCFNANEDTLTIVDVTVKASPMMVSRSGYAGSAYAHQGWLTDDHTFFLLDDELDESYFGHNTRTYLWDVRDLDAPVLVRTFTGTTPAIDHNLYVRDHLVYQANYRAGLRILEMTPGFSAGLAEVGYFDVYPSSDSPNYNGAWSVYPYFESGVIVVSGIEQGLFLLEPDSSLYHGSRLSGPSSVTLLPGETAHHYFSLTNLGLTDSYTVTLSGYAWPTTLLNASPITVTAGATTNITVSVAAPAQLGVSDAFSLTVTSAGSAETLTSSGTTTVQAVAGIETSADMARTAIAGSTITYTLTLTNSGSYTDTFSVDLSGNVWETGSDLLATTPAAGSSTSVRVAVTVGAAGSDSVAVTFTSTIDPGVSQAVLLTTTVQEFGLYLPVGIRP